MIKIIKNTACILLVLFCSYVHAQNAVFLSQGRIEFEKKKNVYAILDEDAGDDNMWKDLEKKMSPQFKVTYFDLQFNGTKTLYKPGRENPDNNRQREEPAEDNTVFTNLVTQQFSAEKNVFDQKFLVQDSTRQIKWKITNETRNIAGFECRRANALIMDSIYVVAYYTDAITTSGGPESFTGLPGMILGLAIPHEHLTWFATKVYTETVTEATLAPTTKGKKVTSKTLVTTLQDRMKDWGKWGQRYMRQIAI